METFKGRMRRIRLRAGFTSQGDAAKAIGCERGTVSMWEAPSSPVKSVSGDWLFDAARAYKVRPEWINDLKSTRDGYPWEPESFMHNGTASRFAGPDPAIVAQAVQFLMFDIDHGAPRSSLSAADLLMDLYRRIEAAGGKLPAAEAEAFEAAARARGQEWEQTHGGNEVDRRPKRDGPKRAGKRR